MPATPEVRLNNEVTIPQLGFGVFQLAADETQRIVELALEVGYRHIDTAAAYNNEAAVGAAVRASGLPRDEVFITTKLRNGEQGRDSARRAYFDSCERLGLEHVDLYLLHWPFPSGGQCVASWQALEQLYTEQAVRAVGVSNFLPSHLKELAENSDLVPAINQIEVHPTFQQQELQELCRQSGIVVEAYSPLGQGADLQLATVQEIARVHGVTTAQVILRWHLQSGRVVIPKSRTPERVTVNLDVFNLQLTDAELESIAALEEGARVGNDPNTFSLSQIR